MLTSNGMTGL